MEIVTFEDGDTNEDLIRKLKAANGPVELHLKAHGGEIPSMELLALITEKVAKSTMEYWPSVAVVIARAGDPKNKCGYKYLDR